MKSLDTNNLSSKIELTANVLIIAVAVVFVIVLVQKFLFKPENKQPQIQPTIGAKVNLLGVDWSRQPRTLILALRSDCRFCNESAPFYQRLLTEAKTKNVKVITVFPTAVEESTAYLDKLGVQGVEVRRLPLTNLQAGATPTLILANDKGEVTNYWVGRLPPDKEDEVINKLNF